MKVVFFSPHSAIWLHAFPEALVAEALRDCGHEVIYITCGRILRQHCVAMSAVGIHASDKETAKQKVCASCTSNAVLLRKKFRLPGYDLADKVTAEDRRMAQQVASALRRTDFLEFEIDGLKLARFALYEFLLNRKKNSLQFDETEWAEYLVSFQTTLITFFGAKRILAEERPDRIVAYNTLYSVNRAICELAESQGIPSYFLHAGLNLSNRLQTLIVGRRNGFDYYRELLGEWPRFSRLPCPRQVMRSITAHLFVLLDGLSVFGYSSASKGRRQSLRRHFGALDDQDILVATMSSHDERFAANVTGALIDDDALLFPTQIEWIKALIDYVSNHPHLFLIIRIHPRDFPNKREQVKSDHARFLEDLLRDLPANVAVNWPTEGISLYDLANETSVFLNAWSAAGKEMSLLGIPVVLYAPSLVAYPPDLNYTATSKDEYFAAVEQALHDGWSIERSRMTYRWLALEYSYSVFDIAESFSRTEYRSRGLIGRIRNRLSIAFQSVTQNLECARRARPLSQARQLAGVLETARNTRLEVISTDHRRQSIAEETEQLRQEMRAICAKLFAHEDYGDERCLANNLRRFINCEAN